MKHMVITVLISFLCLLHILDGKIKVFRFKLVQLKSVMHCHATLKSLFSYR